MEPFRCLRAPGGHRSPFTGRALFRTCAFLGAFYETGCAVAQIHPASATRTPFCTQTAPGGLGLGQDEARQIALTALAAMDGGLIICRAERNAGPLDDIGGQLLRLLRARRAPRSKRSQ